MLIFLDETFRVRPTKAGGVPLGAMCGVALREADLTRIANDVFRLKQKHPGDKFADLVTTIIGMCSEHHPHGEEFFKLLKPCIFRWQDPVGLWHSGLKVLRRADENIPMKNEGAPVGPKARGQDKKACHPAPTEIHPSTMTCQSILSESRCFPDHCDT